MRVKILDDIVFRDLAGEAVILNLTTGTYFGLNEIGTQIWHLLAEHGSTEEVIETILAEYEVDDTRFRHDLDELLHALMDKGLIEANAEETPTDR